MSPTSWLLFCSLALLTAFSPGPAVLLAVTNSAVLGARKALLSSAGNAIGIFMVAATAMLGLGALLKTSAWLFAVLKIAGAVYLVYLGIRQWRSRGMFDNIDPAGVRPQAPARLFLQGLLVATTNPKNILFFTALLPQFMTPGVSGFHQFFGLTLAFAACTMLSHLCYVTLARGMSRWFAHEVRARWFNRIAGTLLASLGVGILRMRANTA
ncbi:threonine/homoserine/homoserine lactone efflux protein [Luteimonas cucumeris]|uniref:Threonine/homoserine/homoserine lactone efflux protein n=1 Tax=Luteimonas cucumeris TaxID=985012 RepID=A0A562KZV3_9GAMM|nr:LysE family translocator [Luteimonas cucumeris]TWI00931.1 threonine/homoserine/homoserine lactone efflux protein [Luteimonas cucumeris]